MTLLPFGRERHTSVRTRVGTARAMIDALSSKTEETLLEGLGEGTLDRMNGDLRELLLML